MRRLALGLLVVLCLSSAAPLRATTAFGNVDTPASGATVSGVVPVRGFVLDMNAIQSVQLFVDGQCAFVVDGVCRGADINLPRIDVLNLYPTYAFSPTAQPGFLTSFVASDYADGDHTLQIVATESADPGNPITIATIPVTVNNSVDQAPIGGIDIPNPDPGVIEGANSAFPVVGWVLDDHGVDHVDVYVDGQIVVGALCCSPRPDIQTAFPTVPLSLYSGWSAYIDSTSLLNGTHTISARATDNAGNSTVLGVRTVQVDNASLNLHPFGAIEFPLDESTIPAICGTDQTISGCQTSPCPEDTVFTLNRSILNPVTGWVLDTGARLDLGQTAYVQLLIDGVIIADTRRDCVLLAGVPVNCYGVNRPDVEKIFPGFVNSDNAGYVFDFAVLDDGTGRLLIDVPSSSGTGSLVEVRNVTSIVPGKHDITVRAGDVAETVSAIGIPLSVNFTTGCPPTTAVTRPSIGNIESPTNYEFISGIGDCSSSDPEEHVACVTGWAFDADGFSCLSSSVSRIEVDVDGECAGAPGHAVTDAGGCPAISRATWCQPRPDVKATDVRVSVVNTGFFYSLDTTKLADSAHDLNVYVTDSGGHRTLIGRRKFVVNNNLSTRGTIRIPGEEIRGPAPVSRHRS